MTPLQRPAALALLDTLAEVFHRPLTPPARSAYVQALDDLPYEAVQYGCVEALRYETFMPLPAIVREYAEGFKPLVPAREEP